MSVVIEPPRTRDQATLETTARHIEGLAHRAPRSLADHARLLHRTEAGIAVEPARHHRDWIRLLEDPTEKAICIIAPPGYAKSTWFSVIYSAWRIGATRGRIRMGLVSNTASQAYALSTAVRDLISDEPLWKLAYPNVRPDIKRGWTRSEFYVTGAPQGPNPTMKAAGIDGPILGKRFDEIIIDDPTTFEQARSEQIMESQRNWLKGTLARRFPPGTGPPDWSGEVRLIGVLTRWSQRDLVPTLRDLGVRIVLMPALGYWDRVVTCPECGEEREDDPYVCPHCESDREPEIHPGVEPLWPEIADRRTLELDRDSDELMFELVMQGNPKVLAGEMFDPEKFQRGTPPPTSRFEQIVMFVDTAGGKDKKKGDYFVIAVVGKVSDTEWWVLDIVRKRVSALDQEAAVNATYHAWEPDQVVIEGKNEGIALYQRLVATTRLPLKEFTPTNDKEFRAIPYANAVKLGYFWVPDNAKWVRPFIAEHEAFPNSAHDDQVDATGGAYAHMDRPGPRLRVLTAGR